ncbi:hypothetical protein Tco_0785030 [Tanacetum coccineum]
MLVIRQIVWRFEAVPRSEQAAIGSTPGGGAEDSSDQTLCEERIYPILAASPLFHLRQFQNCVVVRNSDCMQL